jgi:cobalt/nickel transport system ATP-binding protein
MATPSTTAFEITDATFAYPETKALDAVTLTIGRNERIALLGANGSGKSTLLRLLAGLAFPSAGSVRFFGEPVTEDSFAKDAFSREFRRRVGVVFQNSDVQLFNPTVFDEVAFGPMQLGWSKQEILDRVDAQLNELDILHLKHRPPHRLSGGEKKRVALASVLIMKPDVLLVDEPIAALDPKSQGQVIDFLFGCAGSKTVITATHDLSIVEDIADRCVVLESGRIAREGTPREILEDWDLLQRAHLVHTHRHRHASGEIHAHPHLHNRRPFEEEG